MNESRDARYDVTYLSCLSIYLLWSGRCDLEWGFPVRG